METKFNYVSTCLVAREDFIESTLREKFYIICMKKQNYNYCVHFISEKLTSLEDNFKHLHKLTRVEFTKLYAILKTEIRIRKNRLKFVYGMVISVQYLELL
jgi:hypothetical protein